MNRPGPASTPIHSPDEGCNDRLGLSVRVRKAQSGDLAPDCMPALFHARRDPQAGGLGEQQPIGTNKFMSVINVRQQLARVTSVGRLYMK